VTAIRSVSAAKGKFTQVSNDLIRNEDLSVLARFIVCYVLSLHPDHHFTAEWLETKLPSYGTRSIRAALNELKAHGYMKVSRTSRGRGHWEWEQVISDEPLNGLSSERSSTDETTCENVSLQVSSSVQLSSDEPSSDDGRADKELKTSTTQHEDQELVQGQASRRAHASSARVTRTVDQVIAEVREAVAQVHGEDDAESLSDDEALGLYATYANPRSGPPRDLVAYLSKVLGDAPYLDTFMSNVEPVCRDCCRWEHDCKCPAAA
jgi:hypothetical protein